MKILKDKVLICIECSEQFVFSKGEQKFYQEKEAAQKRVNPKARWYPPKRCEDCREKTRPKRKLVKKITEDRLHRIAEGILFVDVFDLLRATSGRATAGLVLNGAEE